jgi:LemA protein
VLGTLVAVVVVVAGAVLVAVALAVAAGFNRLVRLRNRVDGAWAQIDVQLRRRYDLIPNLVETVKGYAAHERQTLQAVTEARTQAMETGGPGKQAQAENAITDALKSLFAVAESYPDLKANQNFLDLQGQLSDVERGIAYARQYYNDAVQTLNTRIEVLPTSIIAGVFGFEHREYFEADDTARGAVSVRF